MDAMHRENPLSPSSVPASPSARPASSAASPGLASGWTRSLIRRALRAVGLAAKTPRSNHRESDEPDVSTSRGVRVLVADDNPSILDDTLELLRHRGITPTLAADGGEAVALASAIDFDLILMDLQMPVLDGLAATKQIRASEYLRGTHRAPVVAYTSSALADEVLQDCGVDDVLAKPCSADSLQECLQRWCGSEAVAASPSMPYPVRVHTFDRQSAGV